jgi:hypothetical protein
MEVDMTTEEKFKQIVEDGLEKEILPFLQAATTEERKSLVPTIKKFSKYYLDYIQHPDNSYKLRGTPAQVYVLKCAQFVCLNRKEYETASSLWSVEKNLFDEILPWYCPSWFSDFINGLSSRDYLPVELNYEYILSLQKQGYLEPQPVLIARYLATWIYEYGQNGSFYRPEKLTKYKVTLDEHIWFMFQTETTINSSNRWILVDGKQLEKGWIHALIENCEAGNISRTRLLQEAVLASNRNFDKNLSGWFITLFETLQPADDELMALQEDLLTLLSSPHSKVVNGSLKAIKSIVEKNGFAVQPFIDYIPVLLSSETKATVTLALQLMEKIAKKEKAYSEQVALLAASAFLQKDDGLQTRAAKLIQKFGTPENPEIRDAISLSAGLMLSGPRELLTAYLDINTPHQQELPEQGVQEFHLNDFEPLALIADVDELVFLTAQLFDNNQSWHADQFLDAIVRLQDTIREEDLEKFAPAVQRALKFFFGDWRSGQGIVDNMLAGVFLDFILLQAKRYPTGNGAILKLYASFLGKSEKNKKVWEEHGVATTFYTDPNKHTALLYQPWNFLFKGILASLRAERERIILSTPTHLPHWIDPVILIQRLSECQQKKLELDPMDLQIALCRCWLQEPSEAIALAERTLQGELKQLMLFLLEPDRGPTGPFLLQEGWMTAALLKRPDLLYPELSALPYLDKPFVVFTGQYNWQTKEEEYEYVNYEWTDGKMKDVKAKAIRKVIRLDFPEKNEPKEETGIKKIFSLFKRAQERPDDLPPLLVEYMKIDQTFLSREDFDMRRLHGLAPGYPEPLMSAILHQCLKENQFTSETDKRAVIALLQAYYESPVRLGEMGHLFLSASLLCSNKTAATYAAEIWIRDHSRLNNRLLGEMLGKHQRIEFAPMKRFTDLVVAKMMSVSASANAALVLLLDSMIEQLPQEPLRGQKKLLEIRAELGKQINRV